MAQQWLYTSNPLFPQPELFAYISNGFDYAVRNAHNGVTQVSDTQYLGNKTYVISYKSNIPNAIIQYPDGGSTGAIYPLVTGNNVQLYDTAQPVVLYVDLRKVSEWADGAEIKELMYDGGYIYPQSGCTYTSGATQEYDEYYYIHNVAWYLNDNNGKYDILNPRPLATGKYNVALPYSYNKIARWSSDSDFQVLDSQYFSFVSFLGQFTILTHNARADVNIARPYFQRAAPAWAWNNYGVQLFKQTGTSGSTATGDIVTAIKSQEDFKAFCDLWGVPVFFTIQDVQTENTEPQGQPDNPDDDAPQGNGDNSSDTIILPDIYNPPNAFYNQLFVDKTNLLHFKQFLYGDTFLNDIRRVWSDPAEAVVSVTWYPCRLDAINNLPLVPAMPAGSSRLSIGNISNVDDVQGYAISTGINSGTMYIDMGTYTPEPYFGDYLDYNGYTQATIYMPYVGERTLDVAQIMGKTLHLVYYPDITSNTFAAVLYADNNPIGQYTSSMGVSIALGGTDASNYYRDVVSRVASGALTIGGIVAGGITAGASTAAIGVTAGLSGAATAVGALTTVEHTKQVGALTPGTGMYAPQYPYLLISRPVTSKPSAWDNMHGMTAGYSATVGDCTGYLQATDVQLVSSPVMTEQEQEEIVTLLQGGIYI